jgi:hypothetical protein
MTSPDNSGGESSGSNYGRNINNNDNNNNNNNQSAGDNQIIQRIGTSGFQSHWVIPPAKMGNNTPSPATENRLDQQQMQQYSTQSKRTGENARETSSPAQIPFNRTISPSSTESINQQQQQQWGNTNFFTEDDDQPQKAVFSIHGRVRRKRGRRNTNPFSGQTITANIINRTLSQQQQPVQPSITPPPLPPPPPPPSIKDFISPSAETNKTDKDSHPHDADRHKSVYVEMWKLLDQQSSNSNNNNNNNNKKYSTSFEDPSSSSSENRARKNKMSLHYIIN